MITVGTETSDGFLVKRARAGEAAAFDLLVGRYQRAVHAVAFSVAADSDAALDILQDSFIAAYRRLDTLQDDSKFGPWVCGIARNQARQYLRQQHRQHRHELPLEEAHEIPAPDAHAEHITQIREAFSLLTEPQAQIVTLFYMEGYTIRECAGLLGIPEGTVKRRLHDARQRLKKELTDMVKEHLTEFALPEDYRVVIDKPSSLIGLHPTLSWFNDRWVMIWQDGAQWGEVWWQANQFEFWLSESPDGREWSTPRKLEMGKLPAEDARNFPLGQSFVHRGRLYLQTLQHANGIDLYSSADLVNWTAHPRLGLISIGRAALFGNDEYLYLAYPSWVEKTPEYYLGDRIDLLRSSDGGDTWQWLPSPAWPKQGITDAAGIVVENRIYLAWRGHDRDKNSPLSITLLHSDNQGKSWSAPQVVEPLTIENHASFTLQFAAAGETLALAQEVWSDPGKGASEIWVAFSRDGGKTWPEKAVYNPESILGPAMAFAQDGALVLAAGSQPGLSPKPWFIRTRISG